MKLKPIKSNMTELHLEDLPEHGTVILFSYETPVAAYTPELGWIRTSTKYSQTTTKHINYWMGKGGKEVEQEIINKLAGVR